MNERILVVDDEINICELLSMELSMEGYDVRCASDGNTAIELFESFSPDVVLLDIMLPGKNGYEVCGEIKDRGAGIIMLSALGETAERISGLDTGADDYITKPFDTAELLARIRAMLRRVKKGGSAAGPVLSNGPLRLRTDSGEVRIDDTAIRLTAAEFELLSCFMQNADRVLSREMLSARIGSGDLGEGTRSIDMHIQRLRRKLSAATDIRFIETVFRRGYKMRIIDTDEE